MQTLATLEATTLITPEELVMKYVTGESARVSGLRSSRGGSCSGAVLNVRFWVAGISVVATASGSLGSGLPLFAQKGEATQKALCGKGTIYEELLFAKVCSTPQIPQVVGVGAPLGERVEMAAQPSWHPC